MPTGDPFKILSTGDKLEIKRDWYNAVTRATEQSRRQRNGQDSGSVPTYDPEGLILVKNTSSDDVNRFGILGIDDILISDSANLSALQNGPALKGVTPAVASHIGKFVIAAEPIKAGFIGRAFIFGYCPVQITMASSGDKFADVTDMDATQLTSTPFGSAQIIWTSASGGTQWSVVRLQGNSPPDVVVSIGSAISSAGGKYNGTIYGGAMSDAGTGNLSMPDGLTSGSNCLVVNLDEQGQPTHWLQSGGYAAGVYAGMSTEATPRPIVRIDRGVYSIASPNTLSFPAPSTDSATTDTWDRKRFTAGNQYGDAVSFQVVSRMGYNPMDAAPVLGFFYRVHTLAADGRTDTISAETFVGVNTPDSCTS